MWLRPGIRAGSFGIIVPDLFGGDAANYGERVDVMGYDGTGCDDGAFANSDAGHDGGVHPDKGTTFDEDLPDNLFSFVKVSRQVMRDHHAHRGNGYVVFDGD